MMLVLASTSPYRRGLLARLGLPFETARPDVDEIPLTGESPMARAQRLAEAKARAVAERHRDAWVIGSDQVAELNGSWKFILFLIGLTVIWCVMNTNLILQRPLDPYPYQFFNLALAILVGLQGPLIVMSQNRQSLKDRARAETDFKVNLKNEVNIETLLRELSELRDEIRDRDDRPPRAGM